MTLAPLGVDVAEPPHQEGLHRPQLDLDGIRTLGLTAGASTPEASIVEVIAALQRRTPVRISTLPGIVEGVSFPLPSSLGHS